ncbi:hypothetical protein KVT40_000242 [Elsinoe batatas]|uniref:Uncharacterized protein n=1 Tax=Elsinoe batatas TaxID=2601811 RepID=A0A8K0L8E1_9PEZI|nr:hypothetical protein KVT40_000242 [Elsinoe batatas]
MSMVGSRRPPRPGSRILNASLLESVRDSSAIWATGNPCGSPYCNQNPLLASQLSCRIRRIGCSISKSPAALPCRVGIKMSIMRPSDAFEWSVQRYKLHLTSVMIIPKRERFLHDSCGAYRC